MRGVPDKLKLFPQHETETCRCIAGNGYTDAPSGMKTYHRLVKSGLLRYCVTLLNMTRHLKQMSFSQLIVIGLVGLLSLQLTGLSCLYDEFDVVTPDRDQIISTSSNEGSDASQDSRDACPCHVTIAQGESLLLPAAFEHKGTISPLPADYISPMLASFFHPPISS